MLIPQRSANRLVSRTRHVLSQRRYLSFFDPANLRKAWAERSSCPTSFAAFLNTFSVNTGHQGDSRRERE